MAEKNSPNLTHQGIDEADQRTQTVEKGESSNVEVSGNRPLADRIRDLLSSCQGLQAKEELDRLSQIRKTSEKFALSADITKQTETSSKSVEPIAHLSDEVQQEQDKCVGQIHPHLGDVEQSDSIDLEPSGRTGTFSSAATIVGEILKPIVPSTSLESLADEDTEVEEAMAMLDEFIISSTSNLESFEDKGTEKGEANAVSEDSIISSTSLESFEGKNTGKEETKAVAESESLLSSTSSRSFIHSDCRRSRPPTPFQYESPETDEQEDDQKWEE